MEDDVEQTLHIARSVSVYRIPPRPGASGWRSGEWLVSDKLFGGRLRIVSRGELCEVRLEDPNSGELFATCPVPYGQRTLAVEAVSDSSRYFVLRVEDRGSRRHAFLGMGFDVRSDAFDFNEALVRHEQQVARERAARERASGAASAPAATAGASAPASAAATAAPAASHAPPPPPLGGGRVASGSLAGPSGGGGGGRGGGGGFGSALASSAAAEVEVLYRQTADLRLQEGQTLKVNVNGIKKAGAALGAKGGFLSSGAAAAGAAGLPPPPGASPSAFAVPPPPPPPPPPPSASGQASAHTAWMPQPPPVVTCSQPSPQPTTQVHTSQPTSTFQGTAWPQGQPGAQALGQHAAASLKSGACSTGQQAVTLGQDNWATFD